MITKMMMRVQAMRAQRIISDSSVREESESNITKEF